MKQKRGLFIVIEGGEGSGKSAMLALIKEKFPNIVTTREPGGSPFAEKIRNIILSPDAKDADANTQFGLFWAARADHMKTTVLPALLKGKTVVSDRCDASSYAYQIHGQENPHLKKLFWNMREVYLKTHAPDIYIYLDVVPEEGLRRRMKASGQGANHFDDRNLAFHKRIRKGYMEFFKHVPHKIIDANQPLENVKKDFATLLVSLLK